MRLPDELSPNTDTEDDAQVPRSLRPGDLTEAVPLREALTGIGELMQLPRKTPTLPAGMSAIDGGTTAGTRSRNTKTIGMPAIQAPERSYHGARRQERRWLGIGALAVAAVAALAISVSGNTARRDPMPASLRTEWRTSHPSYAHTVLSFTDSVVQIITRDMTSATPDRPIMTRHTITGLEADRRGEETAVVVRYLVEGEPDQIEARLSGGSVPTLRFSRPEGLTWYPASADTP